MPIANSSCSKAFVRTVKAVWPENAKMLCSSTFVSRGGEIGGTVKLVITQWWYKLPSLHKIYTKQDVFSAISKQHFPSLPQTDMLTCVVFPDPVSPTNTRHWLLFNVSINFSLYSQTGSVVRFLYNSQYFGENGNPTNICQGCSLQFSSTVCTFKKKTKITMPHLTWTKYYFNLSFTMLHCFQT